MQSHSKLFLVAGAVGPGRAGAAPPQVEDPLGGEDAFGARLPATPRLCRARLRINAVEAKEMKGCERNSQKTGGGRSVAARAAAPATLLFAAATVAGTSPMAAVPPYLSPESVQRMGPG